MAEQSSDLTVRLPKAQDWLPISSSLVENFSLNLPALLSTSVAWACALGQPAGTHLALTWLATARSVNLGSDSLKQVSQYSLDKWGSVKTA